MDQLKEATNKKDNEIKNIKNMSTESSLKEILSKLQSKGVKEDGVSNKQNEMQIQLDQNSERIRNINVKLNEQTVSSCGKDENLSTAINEEEENQQMELTNNYSKKKNSVQTKNTPTLFNYLAQPNINRLKPAITGTQEG
jgi:hypothetical protein